MGIAHLISHVIAERRIENLFLDLDTVAQCEAKLQKMKRLDSRVGAEIVRNMWHAGNMPYCIAESHILLAKLTVETGTRSAN
jgi:hypothetical protein